MSLVEDFAARIDALPAGSAHAEPAAWYMDIDGVLNVIGRPPDQGWPRYRHTDIPAFNGLAWDICWAPALIELLNRLHAKHVVSFRWLTTWEHGAYQDFAPAIGLDIGQWVAAQDEGDRRQWWKLAAITKALAYNDTQPEQQLVIWTDDDIDDDFEAQRVVAFLHPTQALVLCPNERTGLTPQEFDSILTGIERAVHERRVT